MPNFSLRLGQNVYTLIHTDIEYIYTVHLLKTCLHSQKNIPVCTYVYILHRFHFNLIQAKMTWSLSGKSATGLIRALSLNFKMGEKRGRANREGALKCLQM